MKLIVLFAEISLALAAIVLSASPDAHAQGQLQGAGEQASDSRYLVYMKGIT